MHESENRARSTASKGIFGLIHGATMTRVSKAVRSNLVDEQAHLKALVSNGEAALERLRANPSVAKAIAVGHESASGVAEFQNVIDNAKRRLLSIHIALEDSGGAQAGKGDNDNDDPSTQPDDSATPKRPRSGTGEKARPTFKGVGDLAGAVPDEHPILAVLRATRPTLSEHRERLEKARVERAAEERVAKAHGTNPARRIGRLDANGDPIG